MLILIFRIQKLIYGTEYGQNWDIKYVFVISQKQNIGYPVLNMNYKYSKINFGYPKIVNNKRRPIVRYLFLQTC